LAERNKMSLLMRFADPRKANAAKDTFCCELVVLRAVLRRPPQGEYAARSSRTAVRPNLIDMKG
jgi:hypothetical protein